MTYCMLVTFSGSNTHSRLSLFVFFLTYIKKKLCCSDNNIFLSTDTGALIIAKTKITGDYFINNALSSGMTLIKYCICAGLLRQDTFGIM